MSRRVTYNDKCTGKPRSFPATTPPKSGKGTRYETNSPKYDHRKDHAINKSAEVDGKKGDDPWYQWALD